MTQKFARTRDRGREVFQEDFILDVTEQVLACMKQNGIAQAELAKRLDRSKAYLSQVLSGSRNMTLRTLADICWALGIEPRVVLESDAPRRRAVKLPVRSSTRPGTGETASGRRAAGRASRS
jgi:transcriptional regulator with XRE-family HTH domain